MKLEPDEACGVETQASGHVPNEICSTDLPHQVRAELVAACLDAGLSRPESDLWSQGWASQPDGPTCAAQAVQYASKGIPVYEAVAWHQDGFDADLAEIHRTAGFSINQAVTLAIHAGGYSETLDWLATGLPASTIIDCVTSGITMSEAMASPRESLAEKARFIAALRGTIV